MSEEQYRNIIADVFGTGIVVSGRFDPVVRTDGLLAVGAWKASVTSAGAVQYEDRARTIAAQVVAEGNRETLIPCKPAAENAFDEACAKQFFGKVGRLLFRRPLASEEVASVLEKSRKPPAALCTAFMTGLPSGLQICWSRRISSLSST